MSMRHQPRRWASSLALVGAALLGGSGCGPNAASVKKQKEQAHFHYELSYGYYFDERAPNGDLALQEILQSLALDETNTESHVLAGLIFMGRQRYVDAIAHYQRALELDPKSHTARNNLGATLLATERWDDAIAIFDQLVLDITNPNPGHANNNLGWAWYKKGDLAKAEQFFSAARSLAPKLCLAHNNLGVVYLDREQYNQAIRSLSVATKECPSYAEAHYHLGRAHARVNNMALARDHLQHCVHFAGESVFGERCAALLQSMPPPVDPAAEIDP